MSPCSISKRHERPQPHPVFDPKRQQAVLSNSLLCLQYRPPKRPPQPPPEVAAAAAPPTASLWLTVMVYGNGLVSVVVMGGMWSLKLFTEVMIFMTVVRRVVSMALRTFARSVWVFGSMLVFCSFSLVRQIGNVPATLARGRGVCQVVEAHHSPSLAPRP